MGGERDQVAEAERRGDPYLLYRDGHGDERVLSLSDAWDRVTIGRGVGSDLPLPWDGEVSRVHAELLRLGDDWVVVDDGLSRNGTFLGGDRVAGRRRLVDGDELRVGSTAIRFRDPFQAPDPTRAGSGA